ncbi:putative phosphoglycerate mutase [Psychromicrobium silvestre]|uniref:Putative phosphoglycerate mutase n=1 Tax=Psychromicrobium silvestre TaxID=1645614 RepID=A0A7Y9LRX9_9MICC|nr:histidine phosphatase family protein [Psychromicrobium silvestre]NYE94494.1 putative phosphoglycerate mutase [Psychromicrobium silvestre]
MRRVLFWRHGQTSWNGAGRFQGQTDIPLDLVGHEQARRAAELLAGLRPDAILSSDLGRTRQTAGYLGEAVGLTPGVDTRLRETYAGAWEGLTFAQIDEQFPQESAAWKTGAVEVRPGGGENRLEVGSRVAEAVSQAVSELDDDGLLIVVTHGGAIRSGLVAMLELPTEYWGILSGAGNCHWSVIEEQASGLNWRLTEHNAGSLPEPVVLQEG